MNKGIKKVENKSQTKYKVIGAGVGVAFAIGVGYLLYSRMHAEPVVEESNSINPIQDKKATSVSKSNSQSTSSTSTPNPSAPNASVSVNATITNATAAKLSEALRRATYIRTVDDYGKNWGLLLGSLALIKNVKDYTLVNNIFLQIDLADRVTGAVSKSIVTKTMEGFGKYNAYKIGLTKEYIRIGLKLSTDGKWSLNGLGSL